MRFSPYVMTALLATTVATTVATSAKADPAADWGRVLSDMDVVARKGADVLDSPRCVGPSCQLDANATAQREQTTSIQLQTTRNEWLGLAPKVSLVVRDWGSAYKVTGDRLALIDELRLTSSTRMLLSRVRLSDTRISPFVQVGLGQWRTDPYLLPLTARYTEIAGQATGGIEVRVVGTWQVAFETTMTGLYREQHGAGDPAASMWGTTFASRVVF